MLLFRLNISYVSSAVDWWLGGGVVDVTVSGYIHIYHMTSLLFSDSITHKDTQKKNRKKTEAEMSRGKDD